MPSWEWHDGSRFMPYDQATSAALEAAHGATRASVRLTPAGAPTAYLIDLVALRQTNPATGFARRIRRVDARAAADPDAVATLAGMGFDAAVARVALELNGGNVEAAVEMCLTSPPVPPAPAVAAPAPPAPPASLSSDGAGFGSRITARVSAAFGGGGGAPARAATADDAKEGTAGNFAARHRFGPAAFATPAARPPQPAKRARGGGELSAARVVALIEESVDGVRAMRGERDAKCVTQMLAEIHARGLHMHGPPSSPVNAQVVPALRHIVRALASRPARDATRVEALTTLARACQDCQQVQAREILRMYADLTAQTATLDEQLRYSLVRQKEAAIEALISRGHAATCDLDHTRVAPWEQRAHLFSAYVAAAGAALGLDDACVATARADRFLGQATAELARARGGSASDAGALAAEAAREMSVKEWLQTLVADVNNQAAGAERLVNRDVIFAWAQRHMSADDAHRVFYDDERAHEFAEQDPREPTEENQYQPFLSYRVLVDILVRARMLEPIEAGADDPVDTLGSGMTSSSV